MSATASRTCSQLSKTSSRIRLSNAAATLRAILSPGCCFMPRTAATASGTAAGSATGASSITHTPSGKSGTKRRCDFQRQSRLADPADAGQGHQAMALEKRLQLGDFGFSADEARRGRPEVARCCVERYQRRELGAQAVSSNLRDLHGFRDVPQPPLSESDEVDCADEFRRCTVYQDLAAVAGGHHARSAIEDRAEVILPAQFRLARGDTHPHRQLERTLCVDRGIDSRPRRREHRTDAVTGVLEQPAVVRLDRIPQHPVVGGERRRASRPRRLPIAGSTPRYR